MNSRGGLMLRPRGEIVFIIPNAEVPIAGMTPAGSMEKP
jgi:hypothetical protein